jgi:predicted transcriptional regulator
LDADADQVFSALSPLDELEALLLKNNYHFPHLEDLAVWSDTVVDAILINASLAAQKLGYTYFKQYWDDVQRLALPKLLKMVAEWGLDPAQMASETQLPLPVIFRRLASLPLHKNRPPVGLMTCDGSGSLLRKQPSIGFQAPRVGSACALWPLYSSLTQIGVPLRQHVEYQARPGDSRDRAFYETFSIAERVAPSNFEDPAVVRSTMLIIPAQLVPTPPLITLGSTCRLCSVQACLARSEPSIFTDGF